MLVHLLGLSFTVKTDPTMMTLGVFQFNKKMSKCGEHYGQLYVTGRGGQSALRFARLRMEKRHNYVRKVAEVATQLFITNDKPNIAGLILAGSADFKTELSQSDMFDPVRQSLSSQLFVRVIIALKSHTRA